ncbi:hypothetical protein [Sphingobium boeckii]|uniref:Lipoprotein n=1 Tax=Sphingobium boeckii TaxID=1082345 RepID=A0A7W9AJP6_9SPHN|nr:hypothetical protein [Sphingobium boeckii]MBB5686920.1 hypothetical protein [Sphingobium boeckii]
MRIWLACLWLAGCSSGAATDDRAGGNLEAAAIATGVIPDPATAPVEGLYEHVGEAATDKLCLIGAGDRYRLGISVHLGRNVACHAQGRAERKGEALMITLEGKGDCRFAAAFDGEEVRIPGAVPQGCGSYCTGDNSISGVALGKSSAEPADALAARDNDGAPLCTDG